MRSPLFCGKDPGDAGKVVGDADVGPVGSIEERPDGGKRVVAEFEDEDPAGFQMCRAFSNQAGVEFVALFATVESGFGFVIADFARERRGLASADVGRVGGDEVEKK